MTPTPRPPPESIPLSEFKMRDGDSSIQGQSANESPSRGSTSMNGDDRFSPRPPAKPTAAPLAGHGSDPEEEDSDIASSILPSSSAGIITPYLLTASLVASTSGLLFGWDTGLASGMLVAIRTDLGGSPLTAGQQEAIVSATTLGAIVGSLVAGRAADWLGRRPVILVAALLFLLGSLEQAASQDVPQLVLGRFIVGVAVGQSATVVPLYLAEVAPTRLRGRIVGVNSLLVTGGQVIAYIVNAALFPVKHSWRWMVLVSALPAVVQLVGLVRLDESPRWLVNRGRFVEARRVIKRIYPMASEQQVEGMVDKILDGLKGGGEGRAAATTTVRDDEEEGDSPSSTHAQPTSKWHLLLHDRANRRALILTCGLQAFQQACGFNALMYYSSRLLVMAGFTSNPNSFATLIAVANFAGTVVAMRLVDRLGRRRLLIGATMCMAVCLAGLAGAFAMVPGKGDVTDGPGGGGGAAAQVAKPTPSSVFAPPQLLRRGGGEAIAPAASSTPTPTPVPAGSSSVWPILSLLLMILTTLSYALGLGIIPWLVTSESFSGPSRSLGTALASGTNWTVNLIWSSTYLSVVEAMGGPAGTFGLFAAMAVACVVFAWRWLPELEGVEIEDVRGAFGGEQRGGRDRSGDGDWEGEERQGLLQSGREEEHAS